MQRPDGGMVQEKQALPSAYTRVDCLEDSRMTAPRRDIASLESAIKSADIAAGLLIAHREELRVYSQMTNTAFGMWLRRTPGLDSRRTGLSIHNIDWLIHRFDSPGEVKHNLMIVEEKTFKAASSFA